MQELISSKPDSFEDSTIKRVSIAAAPLALWVKANLQYSIVVEKIVPLERDLASLTKSLDSSRQRVQELQKALSLVDAHVATLKEEFGGKTREAELLKNSLQKAQETIKAAQGLLGKLSGEGSRWNTNVQEIKKNMSLLPKTTLLAAAFVTYLGPETEDVRKAFCSSWMEKIGLKEFDFLNGLISKTELQSFRSQGLPSDHLSQENAAIVMQKTVTPLIVDPTGQAGLWLKEYLKDAKLEIIKLYDDSFIRTLELALRFGKTLVIENVTHIEPIFYPILRKEFNRQGLRNTIQLGEKQIDFDDHFRLFLVSHDPLMEVPCTAAGFINLINFSVTKTGLSSQLLGITLAKEKPSLESERSLLLAKEDDLLQSLDKLEEALLEALAKSEGNILENKALIESLNEKKNKSTVIQQSLEESRKLQEALDLERSKYAGFSVFSRLA